MNLITIECRASSPRPPFPPLHLLDTSLFFSSCASASWSSSAGKGSGSRSSGTQSRTDQHNPGEWNQYGERAFNHNLVVDFIAQLSMLCRELCSPATRRRQIDSPACILRTRRPALVYHHLGHQALTDAALHLIAVGASTSARHRREGQVSELIGKAKGCGDSLSALPPAGGRHSSSRPLSHSSCRIALRLGGNSSSVISVRRYHIKTLEVHNIRSFR